MAENRPNGRCCTEYLWWKLETTIIDTSGKNQIENVTCIGRDNNKESFHLSQTHCKKSVIRAGGGVQNIENTDSKS